MATELTAAIMVKDSSVSFTPTAFSSTTKVEYTFDQVVDDKFFIYVDLTSSTAGDHIVVTVYAAGTSDNDGDMAFRKDIGNLSVTLTSTGASTAYRSLIGPLESSRFLSDDGAIFVDISSTANASGSANIGVAKMPYVIAD